MKYLFDLSCPKIRYKLDPGAYKPNRAYPTDAGLDIFSPVEETIWPRGHVTIDTGVHVEIPAGYYGFITSKSGLMAKDGITSSGIIDASFRGTIKAVLFNHTNKVVHIKKGQKITQLIIQPCSLPELEEVEELSETDRGSNGFGSTGGFYGDLRT